MGIAQRPSRAVYLSTVRPGLIKGWAMHRFQDDRIAVLFGALRWVFYDERSDSPTDGTLVEVTVTERNRSLIVAPAQVWYAVENVGEAGAAFVNLPGRPSNYADPDRHGLPLANDTIPFRFERRGG